MKSILLIFLLIILIKAQIYEPYDTKNNIRYLKSNSFYNPNISRCEINPYVNNNLTLLNHTGYNNYYNYSESDIQFKLNMTECSLLSIESEYQNVIMVSYSLDFTMSEYSSKGSLYIYTKIGEIYIRIINPRGDNVYFILYNLQNYTSNNTEVILMNNQKFQQNIKNIIFMRYFIQYMNKTCDLDINLNIYDYLLNNSINYNLGNNFVYSGGSYTYIDYNLTIINKNNFTCYLNVMFEPYYMFYSSLFSNNVLFYNQYQLSSKYLLINKTLDLNYLGNITINGYRSTNFYNLSISQIRNIQSIYNKLENIIHNIHLDPDNSLKLLDDLYLFVEYSLNNLSNNRLEIVNNIISTKVRYFDTYLIQNNQYLWILDCANYTINGYTFIASESDVLSIYINPNKTNYKITSLFNNITMINPIGISTIVSNYVLNLENFIPLNNINLTLGSQLDFNNLTIITNSSNISIFSNITINDFIINNSKIELNNTLNITGCINISNSNITMSAKSKLYYSCRNGIFENVFISNRDNCEYNYKYLESQLMIFTKDSCDNSEPQSELNLLYIIIPIIVVIIVIIIVIVIVKVKVFREKIFPHRDKTFFRPTDPK